MMKFAFGIFESQYFQRHEDRSRLRFDLNLTIFEKICFELNYSFENPLTV